MRQSFETVKPEDKLLVMISGGYGPSRVEYFEGTVTKMTKTRFSVKYSTGYEQTFNKEDGSKYPRDSGFGRNYVELKPLDEEGKKLINRTLMVRKANSLAGKLHDIFVNVNYRNNMAKIDMNDTEVQENIQLLEKTYEHFKKYMKEG